LGDLVWKQSCSAFLVASFPALGIMATNKLARGCARLLFIIFRPSERFYLWLIEIEKRLYRK